MEYNHREIEARWQKAWRENKVYKAQIDASRPKFYVLDMFPYPSGSMPYRQVSILKRLPPTI